MKTLNRLAVMCSGLAGLAAGGCSGFLGGESFYSGYEISHPEYRQEYEKVADGLAESEDPRKLWEAASLYLEAGFIKKTEEMASVLLRKNTTFGKEIYRELDKWRKDHSDKK